MASNGRGVTLPATLIRSSDPTPLDEGHGTDTQPDAGDEGQGRASDRPARAGRKRRPPAGGPARAYKLHLPESVGDRLHLLALQRRTTASAVAAELLDRALPKLRIERDA
jgi:hypothetical protein